MRTGLCFRSAFRQTPTLCILVLVYFLGGVGAFAQASNSISSSSQDQPNSAPDASGNSKEKKDSKSSEPATTKLRIVVTNSRNDPVANASVYVRFNTPGGLLHHDQLAELDLKTNQDGSAKAPPVPQGKILIQVVAKGWHTYGKWYDIETDEELISIKLEPPPHWY
jgi:hypothetical protein